MSHARTTVTDQPLMFKPGDRVRVINKRNEPEPEGIVIMHDTNRLLVLTEVFLPDKGTTRWWLPDYQCKLIQRAEQSHEPASA